MTKREVVLEMVVSLSGIGEEAIVVEQQEAVGDDEEGRSCKSDQTERLSPGREE